MTKARSNDTVESDQGMGMRSGAVDIVDAVDINGFCTKTYLGEGRWQFVCSGGTSDIRLSVDHTLLVDSNPYK